MADIDSRGFKSGALEIYMYLWSRLVYLEILLFIIDLPYYLQKHTTRSLLLVA